jgi:hypothetical protein
MSPAHNSGDSHASLLQRGKELGWGAQYEPTVIVSRLAVVLCNMCVLIAIAIEVAVAVAV